MAPCAKHHAADIRHTADAVIVKDETALVAERAAHAVTRDLLNEAVGVLESVDDDCANAAGARLQYAMEHPEAKR